MKLVVEIKDALYGRLFDNVVDSYDRLRVCDAVKNGTPLPKRHGRLIDADIFSGDMFCDADLTNQHTCYDSIRKLLDDAKQS